MLSSRKSQMDLSSLRRQESLGSSRRPLLSSRSWSVVHHHIHSNKKRSGRWLWHVGASCVRFIIRARKSTALPKLTTEESREIAAKFYEVMCLNSYTTIDEFLASLGIHMGDEGRSVLRHIKFHEGRALTLYQLLRLLTILKRRYFRCTSSDTSEAFSALAVDGAIPSEVFKATLMKFDLKVQFQENAAVSSASAAERDEDNSELNSRGARLGGIDLSQFSKLLATDDDGYGSKRKADAAVKRFTRLSSVQHDASLHNVTEGSSGSLSPVSGARTQSELPKPIDTILSSVRQFVETADLADSMFKKDSNAELSPLRSELFPYRQNKKKWAFSDVAARIEEVEKRGDVRRQHVSRNARYCSSSQRPPLALLTPCTDMSRKHASSLLAPETEQRLTRRPPRGLPEHLAQSRHTRSSSVPLSERFPVLSQRRERLMDALPRREFTLNGHVPWGLTEQQRADLAHGRRQVPCADDDDHATLRHMASATLSLITRH